ncbi:MAG: error-prone DNA polymerase [Verrucomicrobiales bacterium]|nr:error-prone DNA polymerase [Verrucomicrobiales bacterium]
MGSRCRYVELHGRSGFSFLRGACQPEALVERAGMLGMGAIGVCDRDGFYGSARVNYAGKEHGVRGIVGCELTMEDGSVVPVLVAARSGYRALCRWLTTAKLRAGKVAGKENGEGALSWTELAACVEEAGGERGGALVALTGDEEGAVRRSLVRGDYAGTAAAGQRLVRVFGKGNVYVEVQRHRVRGEGWVNRRLGELGRTLGLPLLATNGVCSVEREGRLLADAFTCLREHVSLDEAGMLLARNGQRYLKGASEMGGLFADLPGAVEASVQLAERLEFTLEDLGYEFPGHACREGETEDEVLRRETYAGARYRYGTLRAKVREQLDKELALIGKLGFCGYFLTVWGIVNAARDMGVMVQGRGSAANSAVCYSLGITACDPVGHGLLFERFLSEGRRSWPDIDLDLPSGERRESVIQWVYRKYAPRGAAMTANVITYRGKSAMREMGKVLGIPDDVLGRFSDLYASGDFKHTMELEEQVKRAGLSDGHPRAGSLMKLYGMAYGMPRHLGQHSGGMIISEKGLDRIVPLENASMEGRVVVQWDKDDCEDLGIVKVDLLGLGMMAAIQDTVELCAERGKGREFDIARLPMDDAATFDMMCAADTVGVFQIESRAQMATLPRMKPRCFYDVVVEVAIIRPGPIVGGLVHPYLNRRDGKEAIDYIHPIFKPVLERTLGVPLFQEQVLKMAMLIAEFTGGEAEDLRRAMSFHRSEVRMQKVMGRLRSAMEERGVEREVQDKVVDAICSFALYGFPESHAISFGLLAYASVWMKAHRAVEFYAALLNNQPMGFYSPATLLKDAKRHGIKVRPVCVLASEVLCLVENERTLRLGLCVVKGLSRDAAERVVAARKEVGKRGEKGGEKGFRGLGDFLLRTRLTQGERRALAKLGALNGIEGVGHRREGLWGVEAYVAEGDLFSQTGTQGAAESERVAETAGGCDGGERGGEEVPRVSKERRSKLTDRDGAGYGGVLRKMDQAERLGADYEGMGMTTGPHPMAYVRETLGGVMRAVDLEETRHGQTVEIAGMVICRQRPGTAKGHLFVSLEDETGISNAFVPRKTFEKFRLVITQERFLRIRGRVQRVDGVVSIYTYEVEGLVFGVGAVEGQSHDFH